MILQYLTCKLDYSSFNYSLFMRYRYLYLERSSFLEVTKFKRSTPVNVSVPVLKKKKINYFDPDLAP